MATGFAGTADLAALGAALARAIEQAYAPDAVFPTDAPAVTPVPAAGRPLAELPELWRAMLDGSTRLASPDMIGHMDTAPHPAAALTEAVVAALNNNLLFRELSPFASRVEEAMVADLAGRLGLAPAARGLFCSGGALANLTALFAAVGGFGGGVDRGRVRLLLGENAHASMAKAAAVLGIDRRAVTTVDGDDQGRIDVAALDRALRGPGSGPAIVSAVLGSTIHGAVDDVSGIAEVCGRHGAWLHVDAVYGAALGFSHAHRGLLAGLDKADSLAVGPQKWMYVPRLSAAVFLRDPALFDRALKVELPYSATGAGHLGQWGLQGSRRADSLTLWATLQILGSDRLGTLVDAAIALTRRLHDRLAADDLVEPTHRPELNLQAFRLRRAPDDVDAARRLHARLTELNGPWVSLATWRGAPLLRAVLLSPATDDDTLAALLDRVRAAAA